MQSHITDYLIIGGGPVGIQASRMIRTALPESSVTVLMPEPFSVIYCAIPYVIEGIIEMSSIAKRDEMITEVGADLWHVSAKSVDFDAHTVTVDDGRVITYKKILIATGAVPGAPPVPGITLENIFVVKTSKDTEVIKKAANSASKVVVIGAGAIGIEQAQAMKELGLEVHLVDMATHPLSVMVDLDFGETLIEGIKVQGINWYGAIPLKQFNGNKAVSEVVLGDGSKIELEEGTDFVIVSAGVRPALDLFVDTKLEMVKDGIVVDPSMRTNLPDVFAAGDCVSFHSSIDGKPLGGKLATNAVPMAKIAAKTMLGKKAVYPGFSNGAATCLGELRVGGTGFTESFARQRGFETVSGYGETTSKFPIMPGAEPVKVKLVADAKTGRLLGGQVLGPDAVAERIDVISLAIQHKLVMSEVAQLSYSAQPWQTFFPARNPIVQAAEDALEKLQ